MVRQRGQVRGVRLERGDAAAQRGRLLPAAVLEQMLTTVPVAPEFGYGLGIYRQSTACGTVWGHDGGIPGYLNVAFNDRSGRRSAEVMLPTEPNEALFSLYSLTVETAVCQMFGQVPATTGATARSRITLAHPATGRI